MPFKVVGDISMLDGLATVRFLTSDLPFPSKETRDTAMQNARAALREHKGWQDYLRARELLDRARVNVEHFRQVKKDAALEMERLEFEQEDGWASRIVTLQAETENRLAAAEREFELRQGAAAKHQDAMKALLPKVMVDVFKGIISANRQYMTGDIAERLTAACSSLLDDAWAAQCRAGIVKDLQYGHVIERELLGITGQW